MGASGPSTGGGGGVGPAGIKTDGTYGTKKDARKASRRNELRTAIKSGGVTGKIISTLTGDAAKKANLNRRKKFISNYNKGVPPSERIDLSDEQISSQQGLSALKEKGYRTVTDTSKDTRSGDQQTQPVKIEPEPVIIKKNIGGTEVQTTDVKLAEDKKKTEEAEDEYDVRRTKRRGRRMTILTPTGGVEETSYLASQHY